MKTYAKNLWVSFSLKENRTEVVIKQSEIRRVELSDFTDALNKRADAEESYAKGL
jgi:hypothetical protein